MTGNKRKTERNNPKTHKYGLLGNGDLTLDQSIRLNQETETLARGSEVEAERSGHENKL